MRVNNRAVETLTFYQWLNQYELTQKKEYKTFQKEVQENLRREYEMWLEGKSQWNRHVYSGHNPADLWMAGRIENAQSIKKWA